MRCCRTPLGIIVLVSLLCAAPALAQTAVEPPPTVDQLKELLQQQKYQDVIRGVQKCLALRGNAAQNYDRYDLFMLRGEAQLQTKAMPAAAESFVSAQKEATDPARKDAARALELLVRRSKATGYLQKTSTTKPAPVFPILTETDRPAAFAALYADELAVAQPKVKAASNATALPPVIEAARSLGDLHAIDVAANGSDAQSKEIGKSLGGQAHKMIADALDKMGKRVEDIWANASRPSNQLNRYGANQASYNTGLMGMTSVESGELKNTIATCEKVVPVANDLASVTGGGELQADAKEAQRVLDRAKEVLNYDYANNGRYTRTPTGTASGTGTHTGQQPPVTPVTPTTPRTPPGR